MLRMVYKGCGGGSIMSEYQKPTREEKDNVEALKAFADTGDIVVLKRIIDHDHIRTADCTINGIEWEVKTNRVATISAIDNALRSCYGQSVNLILNIKSGMSDEMILKGLWQRIHRTDIKQIVIERDGNIERTYSREEILQKRK